MKNKAKLEIFQHFVMMQKKVMALGMTFHRGNIHKDPSVFTKLKYWSY